MVHGPVRKAADEGEAQICHMLLLGLPCVFILTRADRSQAEHVDGSRLLSAAETELCEWHGK
jgi:hypothetical protein